MKLAFNRVIAAVLAAVALVTTWAQSPCPWAQSPQCQAQEVKPVAVVSIASIDKILGDIEYLTRVGGSPEYGPLVTGMAGIFVTGVDRTKPLGVYVTMEGLDAKGVGFIPVKDLATVLTTVKNNLGARQEDAGGGVIQLTVPGQPPTFVKEQAGWAFISNASANLGRLPADPSKLLGGLDQTYNISAQVNMQNLSPEAKKTAVNFLRSQAEAQLRTGNFGAAGDRETAEKLNRMSVNQLVSLIEESDQITVGWGVDKTAKTTYIDFTMTALTGTTAAKRMAMAGETKSNFAGFLMPDAAVTFNLSQKLLMEDIEQYTTLIKPLREKALKEIDNDPSIADAQTRADAKEVLGSLIDVLQKTVEGGQLDAGASLFVEPKALTFTAGLHVADGAMLDKAIKKGAAILAKTEPSFPKISFDAQKHGAVSFHTLSIPVPGGEDEAKQLLGEQLDVVLGVGPKAFYLAFGKNSGDTLKKVIDKSVADASKTVPPTQLNVALAPIARAAVAMDKSGNPMTAAVAGTLDKSGGKDHVRLTTKAIPRGVSSRLEIEEGVIQVIGQAAKMSQGGRPPF